MSASNKTLRYALSGVLAATLLAGTAHGGSPEKDSARDAQKAQAALVEGEPTKAVRFAEAAVAGQPGDAALRALLGQSYLRAGRFESAALTLGEARELGDAGARTALGLALAEVGRGRTRDAVSVLDASRDLIGADDLGLAYALAGETARGVAILGDALRGGEPSVKLRQNLAYAYALDGRWREARVMMSMDVPADQIDGRISDWASRVQPEAYQARVAALLGAPLVTDLGRPERLALVAQAPAEQVAADEAPVAAPVVAAAAELPAIADSDVPPSLALNGATTAPVEPAPAPAPAEDFAAAFAAPAPVAAAAMSQAVIQPVPVKAVAQPRPARVRPATGGTHLVQLGSFSSEANARRAWTIYTSRNANLRGYRLQITPVVVRGKNYWRVAAAGFNAASAGSMCGTVKSRGGACFAYAAGRPMKADAPRFADAGGARNARRR